MNTPAQPRTDTPQKDRPAQRSLQPGDVQPGDLHGEEMWPSAAGRAMCTTPGSGRRGYSVGPVQAEMSEAKAAK